MFIPPTLATVLLDRYIEENPLPPPTPGASSRALGIPTDEEQR